MFEDLVSAAQVAVAAEARARVAQSVLVAAESELDAIRERILDIEKQRDAIVVRRREGEHLSDDGERLALLDADREGLGQIKAERAEAVSAARGPAEAATAALASARFSLRRAETLAAEAAMAEHADGLQAKLLETLVELAEIGHQIGRAERSTWFPSEKLMDTLRRLDVQRARGW